MTLLLGLPKAIRCAQAALDKKATDLVVIDVATLSSIADYLLICTGRSDRQVQTIARAVEDALKAAGTRPLSIEGASRGQWVLMDCGDVIVHVFHQPTREFYDLERLWRHATRVELPEPLASRARSLHAGAGAL